MYGIKARCTALTSSDGVQSEGSAVRFIVHVMIILVKKATCAAMLFQLLSAVSLGLLSSGSTALPLSSFFLPSLSLSLSFPLYPPSPSVYSSAHSFFLPLFTLQSPSSTFSLMFTPHCSTSV